MNGEIIFKAPFDMVYNCRFKDIPDNYLITLEIGRILLKFRMMSAI